MAKARGSTANREIAEFGEKAMFQPTTLYSKGNKRVVRWQYGLFMGGNENERGCGKWTYQNERAWTFRKFACGQRDAGAVMRVKELITIWDGV